MTLNVNYSISCLAANAVSGKIRYMLEGSAMNISPISLSDIPDFLAQDGTDLILANPQIYLSVNNPVANENLGYQTGLCLTAHRNNEAPKEFTLDNEYFEVGYNKNVDGSLTTSAFLLRLLKMCLTAMPILSMWLSHRFQT